MWTEEIHKDLHLVYYNVLMKNPGTLKFMFPIKENRTRLKQAIQETRGMFIRHKNKAPWAIDSVQETFLREKGEGKIKVLTPEETKEILETKSCNFPRIDIVYNLDSPSTRCKIDIRFHQDGQRINFVS